MANVRTYSPKQSEIERGWRVIDAEGETLGRLATRIATILRGKDKPTYTTHMSVGDNVIVINAEKVRVTGQKEQNKIYYRHSQYPGGLRKVTLSTMREKHPDRIIQSAVKGMLPHNRLGRQIMRHLHIYAGPEHPHEAQMRAGMGAAGRRKQAELETQAQQPAATPGSSRRSSRRAVDAAELPRRPPMKRRRRPLRLRRRTLKRTRQQRRQRLSRRRPKKTRRLRQLTLSRRPRNRTIPQMRLPKKTAKPKSRNRGGATPGEGNGQA